MFNPDINWTDLLLAFGGKARISAALAEGIEQRGELDNKTKHENKYKREVDPILLDINKWLLYNIWSKDYKKNEEMWRKKYHIGPNNVGYLEKAFCV